MTELRTRIMAGLGIFVIALAFRASWLFDRAAPPHDDEIEYSDLANNLLDGKGYVKRGGVAGRNMAMPVSTRAVDLPTAFRTPGYPLILAAIYGVTGRDYAVTRRVNAVLSGLTAPLLFSVSLLLFGRMPIALLAGLGWAALPTSRVMAGTLCGEEIAATLLIVAVIAALVAKRYQSGIVAAAAGLVLSFAILTRGFLLPVVLAVPAWFVARRSWRLAVISSALTIIPLVLWIARNTIVLGAPTLSTQTQETLWQGNNAWARGSWPGDSRPQREYLLHRHPDLDLLDEVGYADLLGREARREIIGHPGRMIWLLPRKALLFFTPVSYLGFDAFYLALLPFAVFGACHLWSCPGLRCTLWLVGFPILGALSICLLTYGDVRFRQPVNPMIVLLASVGIVRLIGCFFLKSEGNVSPG